jgi:hypothetical protein
MGRIGIIVLLGLLSACTPQDLTPVQRATICHALVKGIPYNTYDKESLRYAGMLLALDVKQHNQIWLALKCGKPPRKGKRHG